MKIAMIGHKRIPSREGGVEIVVEELSTRLVKLGHEVDVYNRKGKNVQDKNVDTEKKDLREYKGAKLKVIPTINKKGVDALIYSFLGTIRALFGRYDVIHYHAEGSCAMLWLPHLFGIKTVATIHGLDWKRSKWGGFATKYIKFGEKIAAKYADEIIVLSKGVQKYFKDTYNRDTHFIPNGVNKPEIKDAEKIRAKWGLEKDNYILFLARIVPEKGLHYLIEAYKQIDTNKKLVIAGGASHTNDYLKKIKEMVKDDDRIIMTGFVQGQELEELYSNCYLYCLPSDIEGMPISLLEAMSYGCNCLVSDIEENTQVTGEFALTFEKGNVEKLKEKLIESLNVEKKFNKEEIEQYVIKRNNWEDVTKNIEKLLEPKKKAEKKNGFYYFLLFCIYLFVFQNVIELYVPIFKYFDELISILALPIIFFKIKRKDKNILNKENILLIGSFVFMMFLGICSNIKYKYQEFMPIFSDIIVVFKFFGVYYFSKCILTNEKIDKYKDDLLRNVKCIIMFLFIFTILNYVFNIFDGDIRYGIKSNRLFYQHTTFLVAVSVFLISLLLILQKKTINRYSLIVLFIMCTTLRSKAIAFAITFVILGVYLERYNKKISIIKLAMLGIICVVVAFNQVKYYFVEIENSARATLLKTSIEIAEDYFPIGTGFATFGSHFSAESYSVVYRMYNIQNIYGLEEGKVHFVSDNFWPMILGQFGVIGLICYVVCIILIFKNIQDKYSERYKYYYIAKIACIVYLLISSTSESAFVNSISIPLGLILGIELKNYKDIELDEREQIEMKVYNNRQGRKK